MDLETNRDAVRRFYAEIVGRADFALLDRLVGPDYVDHNAVDAGRGAAVVRQHVEAIRATFPDFTLTIEAMIAERDFVVTRVRGRGMHSGLWLGIPPTGKLVTVKGINIDRLEGGKLVEHWGEADTISMLQQMGVDPFRR